MAAEIFSDLEKDKIAQFVGDTVLLEAVRKVFLQGIYSNGTLKAGVAANPLQNFALGLANSMENTTSAIIPDAELGQDLRAAVKAIRIVELGFKELEKLVPEIKDAKRTKPNKAL